MFAEIFDRHYGELYRYLRRQAGADLAADLAADTFTTAFARRGSYRPASATTSASSADGLPPMLATARSRWPTPAPGTPVTGSTNCRTRPRYP